VVTLLEDEARRLANCANNERRRVRKQKRWLRSATGQLQGHRGRTPPPPEPKSSGEDDEVDDRAEENGEITPSPILRARKSSPRLVTSSVCKRGSLLVVIG
jgi:hypothetical protein